MSNTIDFTTLTPDKSETERFLRMLNPMGMQNYDFRTFDDFIQSDGKGRRLPSLNSKCRGTITEVFETLCGHQRGGAGIFFTVNVTDGIGVKLANIKGIRAVWIDDDEVCETHRTDFPVEPTIIVESSKGKFHYYWVKDYVSKFNFDTFKGVMRRFIQDWGHDKNASDVARVLRVPGFYHCKAEPFMTRVVGGSGKLVSLTEILKAFPPVEITPPATFNRETGEIDLRENDVFFVESVWEALRDMPIEFCSERDTWLQMGMAINHQFGDDGFPVWDQWSQGASDKYDYEDCVRVWHSFGGRGVGDVTIKTIFHYAYGMGYLARFPISEEMKRNNELLTIEWMARAASAGTIATTTGILAEWIEPMPLVNEVDALPYPIEAFPGEIGDAIEEVQKYIQSPLPLIGASALSSISLAAQQHIDVRRDANLVGPVSLFFLSQGESGERKTSGDNMFSKSIREYEKDKRIELRPEMEDYTANMRAHKAKQRGIEEGIKKAAKDGNETTKQDEALRELETNKPRKPRIPKLIQTDATQQALGFNLAYKYPSAGIFSAEGGAVLGSHAMKDAEIMGTLSFWDTLWDGGEFPVERRTSESYVVRGARLSLNIQVQPQALDKFMENNGVLARGIGFFARCLVADPVSTQGFRPYAEPPESFPALTLFNERISQLLNQPVRIDGEEGLVLDTIELGVEAKRAWIEFHDEVEAQIAPGGRYDDAKDAASKIAENAARVAAILHFYMYGNMKMDIDIEEFERAATIVRWHLNEFRRIFNGLALPESQRSAVLLDHWLRKYCDTNRVATVRKSHLLQSGPSALRSKSALDPVIIDLQAAGRVRQDMEGGKNVVEVNPALLNATS